MLIAGPHLTPLTFGNGAQVNGSLLLNETGPRLTGSVVQRLDIYTGQVCLYRSPSSSSTTTTTTSSSASSASSSSSSSYPHRTAW